MTHFFNCISLRTRNQDQFSPAHLMFKANLQEFLQKVSSISDLPTNGKLSSEGA